MANDYRITMLLNCKFNSENIRQLLERGAELNLEYYKFMHYEGKQLNPVNATSTLLEDELHCLTTKINNVYTNLHCISDSDYTLIMISSISHEKLKNFKNSAHDIDIAAYARILLDVTQDFQIISMTIEKA